MSHSITLPDTLSQWPWNTPRLNLDYEDVGKESTAWIAGFEMFKPKVQRAFDKGKFHLLAGLAYPSANRDILRAACDLMNIFFLIDDHTDISNLSEVQTMTSLVRDALLDPYNPRVHGEWPGAEIVRQFWVRTKDLATSSSQTYFVTTFNDWLQSLVEQAEDRDNNHVRDIDNYLKFRRRNIGLEPALAILEFDMELSDEFRYHPITDKLIQMCCDLLIIDNDMLSYSKEQARGDDKHNIVTIIMHQFQVDVQNAIYWAAGYSAAVVRQFAEICRKEPRWGGMTDVATQAYLNGLGNWVYANNRWSFESERYFGNRGTEIMRTRVIPLLPREKPEHVGPAEINM